MGHCQTSMKKKSEPSLAQSVPTITDKDLYCPRGSKQFMQVTVIDPHEKKGSTNSNKTSDSLNSIPQNPNFLSVSQTQQRRVTHTEEKPVKKFYLWNRYLTQRLPLILNFVILASFIFVEKLLLSFCRPHFFHCLLLSLIFFINHIGVDFFF